MCCRFRCKNWLVIVHNLDVVRIPVFPNKAEAPLVIDSYTMLPLSVAMQCFQAITRRGCQVAQLRGAVQLPKLAAGNLLDRRKAPAVLSLVKALSLRATERLDHIKDSITLVV